MVVRAFLSFTKCLKGFGNFSKNRIKYFNRNTINIKYVKSL